VVPSINAHARVRIFGVTGRGGNLPIAAPDNNIQTAEARFIDEDTGALLGSTPLLPAAVNNGLSIFQSSTPASVQLGPSNKNVGVRIVLSSTASTNCAGFLTECYDPTRATGGLLYLRGWTAGGTSPALPAPPLVRSVSLLPAPGFCTSSAFFSDRAQCTRLLVRASVPSAPSTASIWANPPGCNNSNSCRVPLTNIGGGVWQTQASNYVAIPSGTDDRFEIRLSWEQTSPSPCRTGGSNTCKGWLENQAVVQRAFGAAVDLSGPIKAAR
jgi:hypothetical protein